MMMPEASATAKPSPQFNWPKMLALLRPHWKTLTLALLAVVVETSADLLEPWPLKIIVDNLLQSKPLPHWLAGVVSHMAGHDKLAILNFAVLAVAVIAIVGAIEKEIVRVLAGAVDLDCEIATDGSCGSLRRWQHARQ